MAYKKIGSVVATAFIARSVTLVMRRSSGWQRQQQHQVQSQAQDLMDLWTGAQEVMLVRGDGNDVGTTVVLQPGCIAEGALPLPPHFKGRSIYALTAFDPPGVERSLEANTEANVRLGERIRDPSTWFGSKRQPSAVWPSYGFSLAEGWREDGYSLVFDLTEDADAEYDDLRARAAVTDGESERAAVRTVQDDVLRLAEEFGQGAIFAYREALPADVDEEETLLNCCLVRATIPCRRFGAMKPGEGAIQAEAVVVRRVRAQSRAGLTPAQDSLLTRTWAGFCPK
jgi:hypothetical protein